MTLGPTNSGMQSLSRDPGIGFAPSLRCADRSYAIVGLQWLEMHLVARGIDVTDGSCEG